MSATYLVRFDDICATMQWRIWNRIEEILRENEVAPLLSVVPDNRDERLMFESANERFWERVRTWQQWGWAIGMHGYQHRYVSADSGMVGVKRASEFAGLPLDEQRSKLEASVEIFRREGVQPGIWVAPGHTFDRNTLRALKSVGLTIISDGLFLSPRRDPDGMLWIPQQQWRFRRLPFGLWTVCLHHNRWDNSALTKFARDIAVYKRRIVALSDVLRACRHLQPAPLGSLVPRSLRWLLRLRLYAKRAGVPDRPS